MRVKDAAIRAFWGNEFYRCLQPLTATWWTLNRPGRSIPPICH